MKLLYAVLIFCISITGCYSQLQHLETVREPSESSLAVSEKAPVGEPTNSGISENVSHTKSSSRTAGLEAETGFTGGSSFYSNTIWVCWDPPYYDYAYHPSDIEIYISPGIIRFGGTKKSGTMDRGPRTTGPDRVSGTKALPGRDRSINHRGEITDSPGSW